VTSPPDDEVLSLAAYRGSTVTDPVKYWDAPFADGRDPFGAICMLSALAGAAAKRPSAKALATMKFMLNFSFEGWSTSREW
jgi:hypothetical protein